jgi:hypothetical protein
MVIKMKFVFCAKYQSAAQYRHHLTAFSTDRHGHLPEKVIFSNLVLPVSRQVSQTVGPLVLEES